MLKAKESVKSYGMIVRTVDGCLSPSVIGGAVLKYKGAPDSEPSMIQDTIIIDNIDGGNREKNSVVMTSDLSQNCDERDKICITEIKGKRRMPKALEDAPDVTMYLPINYSIEKTEFTGE